MQQWFYNFIVFLSSRWGDWFFLLPARAVALGYFLFFPGRVLIGARFYRALFPQRSGLYHMWCTFKQFQNFTTVFFYRRQLEASGHLSYAFDGMHYLRTALERKSGGILLMSHMGNWEVAAHLLKRDAPEMKLMLFMGRKEKEEIEGLQKESLAERGISIVSAEQGQGSPFDLVEAARVLREGGFVSMTGDRLWRNDQRSLPVSFLGHTAYLPETPHMLALVTGVPLYLFFAAMPRKGRFYFCMTPPLHVKASIRSERAEALTHSAQAYADAMQAHLRAFPFEWYHFESFLKN